MRSIHKIRTREHRRARRRLRVRKKVVGSAGRPRLVVFRSAKHVYAQLVDDARGMTLAGASDRSEGIHIDGKGKTAKSFALGQLIAAKAKRSEEHTSELQSQSNLVCRLLLEKKKKK